MFKFFTSITFAVLAFFAARVNAGAAPTAPLKVLAYGDSLTAAYQLDPAQGWPAVLQKLLAEHGVTAQITNAGVSGDTTAQGLRRVNWSLKGGPYSFVLLELGANDGLRQLPVADTEKNLRQLIKKFKDTGARVLLMGMRLPINLDAQYRQKFEALFPRLANEEHLSFLPFLLDGVATHPELNLEDQMHPNAAGYQIVARNVLGFVCPLMADCRTR